jgi:hypothetical protein
MRAPLRTLADKWFNRLQTPISEQEYIITGDMLKHCGYKYYDSETVIPQGANANSSVEHKVSICPLQCAS